MHSIFHVALAFFSNLLVGECNRTTSALRHVNLFLLLCPLIQVFWCRSIFDVLVELNFSDCMDGR